jgi:hypothetical protein
MLLLKTLNALITGAHFKAGINSKVLSNRVRSFCQEILLANDPDGANPYFGIYGDVVYTTGTPELFHRLTYTSDYKQDLNGLKAHLVMGGVDYTTPVVIGRTWEDDMWDMANGLVVFLPVRTAGVVSKGTIVKSEYIMDIPNRPFDSINSNIAWVSKHLSKERLTVKGFLLRTYINLTGWWLTERV